MKSKKTTPIVVLFTVLLVAGMVVWWKTTCSQAHDIPSVGLPSEYDELPENIKAEFDSIEERLGRHPERFVFYVIRKMAASMDEGDRRKSIARACARRFLSFKLKNDSTENMRDIVDYYVEYIYSIDDILRDAKVSDEERIEFFFSALATYRNYSCRPVPNEEQIKDFYEWNNWVVFVHAERGEMLCHLQNAMRLIYDKGLRNINDRYNVEVLRRFVDFYIGAVAMVKERDEYQKKHIRPLPKDRLCWSIDLRYLHERRECEMPSVISFGRHKINLVKWKSGEKEKIIADILSKSKTAKGTTQLRTEDVEVKVDGID